MTKEEFLRIIALQADVHSQVDCMKISDEELRQLDRAAVDIEFGLRFDTLRLVPVWIRREIIRRAQVRGLEALSIDDLRLLLSVAEDEEETSTITRILKARAAEGGMDAT